MNLEPTEAEQLNSRQRIHQQIEVALVSVDTHGNRPEYTEVAQPMPLRQRTERLTIGSERV